MTFVWSNGIILCCCCCRSCFEACGELEKRGENIVEGRNPSSAILAAFMDGRDKKNLCRIGQYKVSAKNASFRNESVAEKSIKKGEMWLVGG